MPIQLLDQETLNQRIETAFENEANELNDAMQKYIRRRFDNANIDATAIAIIQLAEEEELFDLVGELKEDYFIETGRRVVA